MELIWLLVLESEKAKSVWYQHLPRTCGEISRAS